MDKKELEQTLVLIKPDALKNSLTGYVLSQLSQFHTGLRFAGAIMPTKPGKGESSPLSITVLGQFKKFEILQVRQTHTLPESKAQDAFAPWVQ